VDKYEGVAVRGTIDHEVEIAAGGEGEMLDWEDHSGGLGWGDGMEGGGTVKERVSCRITVKVVGLERRREVSVQEDIYSDFEALQGTRSLPKT